MKTIKIKTEAKYANHDIKANKSVNVQFKMPYTELTNYIQSVQMLNENVTVAARIGADKKPIKLGSYQINAINIDRDGECKLKFNSQLDFVDASNLNELAGRTDEPLMVLMKANIDIDDDDLEEVEEDE